MSKKILVIEDTEDNRQILRDLLGMAGYDMVEAHDGAEGVAKATEHKPDLILMDIQMPVMDGITAAREIREAEATTGRRRTPIVALTANALTHQVEEYLAAGMDAHVAKPIEIAKLYDAISAVLTAAATGVQSAQRAAAAG
jgi:two-component system, sensor histidine kinase